jgi:hypothetical protein
MTVESTPLTTTRGEMLRTTANGNSRVCRSWTRWGGPDPGLALRFDDERVRNVVGLWIVQLRICCGSVDRLTYAPNENRLRWGYLRDLPEGDFVQAVIETQRRANDFNFALTGAGLPASVRTQAFLAKLESLRG